MPADPPFDLNFRPATYENGPTEIDYPILAAAPMYGGGSYLPRLKPGEVEIAGIALASTATAGADALDDDMWKCDWPA